MFLECAVDTQCFPQYKKRFKVKKKEKIRLYAVIMIAVFLLAGCAKNEVVNYQESNKAVTTITFFGNKNEPENVTVIEEIISDFMQENSDIRVSYESLKGNEYYEALEKRMAAGEGDDVFMVNHDTVLKLEAKKQLEDLSKLKSISGYTDEMLSQMKENGKIYWVPTTVSVFGLYCNMDLLQKYDQKVPTNLSEWETVCRYFKGQGMTPIIANNDISLKTLAIGQGFYSLYQEHQQKETFRRINDGEEELSDYLSSGFSLAENFISQGYIDAEKSLKTEKTSDDLEEFAKGKSPFMLTGAWAVGRVESMLPDFEFQVVPYPILENDSLLVVNADTRLSVNADSKHKDAAIKFVEYFTNEENIQKFANQQSSFSPLKGGSPSSVKEIQPLVSCYQSGRVVIGTDTHLNLPIWDLTAQVSKKLLSGESLKAAMTWMDQQSARERGAKR